MKELKKLHQDAKDEIRKQKETAISQMKKVK